MSISSIWYFQCWLITSCGDWGIRIVPP
jgi:hypothetical protein